MKKLILITAMILMIPAMCLANYRITYVEYFTPDKPGPLHQRIKIIEVKQYFTYRHGGFVTFTDVMGKDGAIKSTYIKIEEVKKEE